MKRTGRKRGTRTKGISDVQLAAAIVRKIEQRIYEANKIRLQAEAVNSDRSAA